jgi:hypothetical protein
MLSAKETTMRNPFPYLSSAILCVLLVAPVSAQQVPDFSGKWQRADGNDIGSGWGDVITVKQESSRLEVDYVFFAPDDRQAPLQFVYDLAGHETRNSVMMGRGVQTQTSHANLIGERLEIVTLHELTVEGRPVRSEVRQLLSLDAQDTLIVEVTRAGVLGGPATTSRSVYRRVPGV